MQNTELRELTASEELTLEQEYAMQRESARSLGQNCSPDGRTTDVNRKLAGR